MKNTLILLLSVTLIASAAFGLAQKKKVDAQNLELIKLQTDLDQKSRDADEARNLSLRASEQRGQLMNQVATLATRLRQQTTNLASMPNRPSIPPVASTESTNAGGGLAGMLASMMKDPAMKNIIRDQQNVMMDQMYGPLFKQLKLTPEETAKFKEALLDQQMKAAENATELLGQGTDADRSAATSKIADAQTESEAAIKDLLGDARYSEYKDYQQTASERVQLNAWRRQAGGDVPALTDQQNDQLLAIMQEEKLNAANSGALTAGLDKSQTRLDAMLSDEQMTKLLDAQQSISQRVTDRARQVLSPDQWQSFAQYQTNQLQMVRMGMSVARKMFAPAKP